MFLITDFEIIQNLKNSLKPVYKH